MGSIIFRSMDLNDSSPCLYISSEDNLDFGTIFATFALKVTSEQRLNIKHPYFKIMRVTT